MIKVKDVYDFLDCIAPFETALSFDNCGIIAGNEKDDVSKILVALDITPEVIEEAKALGANLIISHHPVIFKPLKQIDFKSPISALCKLGINAICAHTNLDIAKNGVNFQLASKLKLNNLSPLTYEEGKPMGLTGDLEVHLSCKDFAKYVKENLSCDGVRYTDSKKEILKVAVCSGSGGEFVQQAAESHADAFVTGEIKHSHIIQANRENLMIVDAGHFKTENVIVKPLTDIISEKFSNIPVYSSNTCTDKIKYL